MADSVYVPGSGGGGGASFPDPAYSLFRLAADGVAIGPTIADYFGANSALDTQANEIYELFYCLQFAKATSAPATFTLVHTSAFTNLVATWSGANPVTAAANRVTAGIVGATAAASALPATASLPAANHEVTIRAFAECGTAGNLRLRVTSAGGTVTPLRGSYYTARLINSTNIGTFVA